MYSKSWFAHAFSQRDFMKDNAIDVEIVPVKIVRCPRCGSRNRLLKQERVVTYRCGGCATSLENPFLKVSIIKRRFRGILRRSSSPTVGKYIGLLVIGILVVVVLRDHRQRPRERDSDLTPPAPILTIDSQPSRPSAPETPVEPSRSLENGTILTDLIEVGHGEFSIQNDTDRDAVVKLVNQAAKRSVLAVYITAHSSTTIDEIPEGSFTALCGQGVDWDDGAKVFKRKKSFGKFEPDMDFTMKLEQTEGQIIRRYKSITLELAPSLVGNITRSDISEKRFSEY
jgi:hypothetical protein